MKSVGNWKTRTSGTIRKCPGSSARTCAPGGGCQHTRRYSTTARMPRSCWIWLRKKTTRKPWHGRCNDLDGMEITRRPLEFQRMFSGEMDANNAFLDIQAGSGGTEAQDWANMLLRMYLRWGERHGFTTELIEVSRRGSGRYQERDHQDRRAIMPSAGCVPKPACIDWCANRRLIPVIGAIPRLPRCLSRRKSMMTIEIEINPGRFANRHLPRQWRRWPARQPDRVGGAHYA